MRENLKLGMILFAITAVAGLLLGMVYDVTKGPIARQEMLNSLAIDEVLPAAKEVKKVEAEINADSIVKEVNAGYDGDKIVGHIVKVAPKGFKGAIEMQVGISTEGKIEGIKILSHTETPGLGANIEKEEFKSQLKGKSIENPIEVVKSGASKDNEIDSIAGATISSNAVASGINEAITFYRTAVKGEEAAPEKTKESLVKEILPNSDKLEASDADITGQEPIKEVDKIFEGDKHIGYAFMVTPEGFHGPVEIVLVISLEGKVEGMRVLKHTETPGLGAEAEKEPFWSQFTGKSVDSKVVVDAIANATITSDAIMDGVNKAVDFFNSSLSGEGGK